MKPTLLKSALAIGFATAFALPAFAQDKAVFATNWRAQGMHGGFYQALADGTYRKFNLDVTIMMGGPQVNNRPLLPAGRIDFLMAGNLLLSFENVKNKIPTTVVAAIFQKDPQVLMAHPGQYKSFADLKTAKSILVSKDGQFSYWLWMKAEHGFKDEQVRPYTFNLGPWLADKTLVQQGYATSEPSSAEKAGVKPDLFLLADNGWNTYSTTIETRPDYVQRFIDASMIGWYNFIYGDRKLAKAAIRKDNPEITEEKIDEEVATATRLGIVESGEALAKGIGALNLARVKDFHDKMVKAGIYKAGEVDLAKVATDRFVNKGVGLEVKKALGK
jgi:NitT/TauT family transport system substrate-binding protein